MSVLDHSFHAAAADAFQVIRILRRSRRDELDPLLRLDLRRPTGALQTLLSVLTIIFGPQIVDLFQTVFVRHWAIALAVVAAAILLITIVVRRRARVPTNPSRSRKTRCAKALFVFQERRFQCVTLRSVR